MNLPTRITFTNKRSIKYQYDAAGVKLRKVVDDGNHKITTYYMGGYQYQSDGEVKLQFFPTSEGYVKALYKEGEPDEPMAYAYVYNYTDHLGNIRLSYAYDKDTNEVKTLEENHYYPFGLKHGFYNEELYEIALKQQAQNEKEVKQTVKKGYNYKYNGKELQDELGLNWYDYGARNYDAALGRWFGVDNLSEKYYYNSPYHYAGNNPVLNFDIDGNEFTESAQEWADRIIKHANNKIRELNANIARYEASRKGASKGRIKRLNKKIKKAKGKIGDFNQTITEMGELENSDQVYDYQEMEAEVDQSTGLVKYGFVEYDFDSNHVIIHADSYKGKIGSVAHEFKHAFQFEEGVLDFGENKEKGILYTDSIECQGDLRAKLFGFSTYSSKANSDPYQLFQSLTPSTMSKIYAKRATQRHAYRFNKKTYIWIP